MIIAENVANKQQSERVEAEEEEEEVEMGVGSRQCNDGTLLTTRCVHALTQYHCWPAGLRHASSLH